MDSQQKPKHISQQAAKALAELARSVLLNAMIVELFGIAKQKAADTLVYLAALVVQER